MTAGEWRVARAPRLAVPMDTCWKDVAERVHHLDFLDCFRESYGSGELHPLYKSELLHINVDVHLSTCLSQVEFKLPVTEDPTHFTGSLYIQNQQIDF